MYLLIQHDTPWHPVWWRIGHPLEKWEFRTPWTNWGMATKWDSWLLIAQGHNLFRSHCLQPHQQQNSQSGFMVGHSRLQRDVYCRTVSASLVCLWGCLPRMKVSFNPETRELESCPRLPVSLQLVPSSDEHDPSLSGHRASSIRYRESTKTVSEKFSRGQKSIELKRYVHML